MSTGSRERRLEEARGNNLDALRERLEDLLDPADEYVIVDGQRVPVSRTLELDADEREVSGVVELVPDHPEYGPRFEFRSPGDLGNEPAAIGDRLVEDIGGVVAGHRAAIRLAGGAAITGA